MTLKYEKPKIIPFNAGPGETGAGLCNDGSADAQKCQTGSLPEGRCQTDGNSAAGDCKSTGFCPVGACNSGTSPSGCSLGSCD
jgi:hypothetical protein